MDQAYNELYRKNNELNTAKMSLESNIINLQSVLEEEKSTKSDNNQQISELESELGLFHVKGIETGGWKKRKGDARVCGFEIRGRGRGRYTVLK